MSGLKVQQVLVRRPFIEIPHDNELGLQCVEKGMEIPIVLAYDIWNGLPISKLDLFVLLGVRRSDALSRGVPGDVQLNYGDTVSLALQCCPEPSPHTVPSCGRGPRGCIVI